jgi:hypothetical protein
MICHPDLALLHFHISSTAGIHSSIAIMDGVNLFRKKEGTGVLANTPDTTKQ